MSELKKSAGKIELTTYLGGWPRWTTLEFDGGVLTSLQPEDLRDLRYCIDRLLVKIEEHDGKAP